MFNFDAGNWALFYFILEWVIRLVMLAIVPVRRSPQSANAWLAFIFILPVPGLILFWLIGSPKMPKARRAQVLRFAEEMRPLIEALAHSPFSSRPDVAAELKPTVELATRLGHFKLVEGNKAELLADYQGSIDRLVADIDAAQSHVHLLYYIFADDQTTAPVLAALTAASQRGVRCRVLIDALGSKLWRRSLIPKLRDAGVEIHEVLPYGLLHWKYRWDMRNHRKIAVIDGKIGYVGSQNLVAGEFKEGIVYEEMVVRVEGPVVLQLQFVFTADWYLETEQPLNDPACFPAPESRGALIAQALPSGPAFPVENNERLLVALMHGALHRVVVTTPYFIPDEALLQAMQTAVLRGVEVHLIVPAQRDQLLVGLAQESYYGQLMDMGVRIHRYPTHFLHAKHASFDDQVVVIGSSNMDMRSFLLNSEISLVSYDRDLALALRQEQERYMANAVRLRAEEWSKRGRPRRIAQGLARLMSPLL